MGKSGYLPNIAGDFTLFKNKALNYLDVGNFNGAYSALDNLNRCLGDEYHVIISDEKYHDAIDQETVYLCNHCTMQEERIVNEGEEDEKTKTFTVKTRIKISKVRIIDLLLSQIESVILNKKTERVWFCPECRKENKMDDTTQLIPKREQPIALKVVPNSPIRPLGIEGRTIFSTKFEAWFHNFLGEITSQEVLYRVEWKNLHDGEEMSVDYKDKGDQ